MMKPGRVLGNGFCILAIAGCVAMVPPAAHATDVVVCLFGGRSLEGELLVVRDTALLIDRGGGYKMWEKQRIPEMAFVPFDSIQRVDVKGGSCLWYGAAIGLCVGVGIGAAAAPASSQDLGGMAMTGWMVLGGLGGLLAGSAVGASISSRDIPVTKETPGGFSSLKSCAKYDGDEPPDLKKIQ
jgi:hypothetical protein